MADEIVLSTPKILMKDATRVVIDSFTFTEEAIDLYLSWYDTDGTQIKQEHVSLRGVDYAPVFGYVIKATDVGKTIGQGLKQLIRSKLIALKSL